jgi:hypothetical protein
VLPYLQESFELAPSGAVRGVAERFRKSSLRNAGWRNCHLRTTFEKIVVRPGLQTWSRRFHSLRATRQTELARIPHVGWVKIA